MGMCEHDDTRTNAEEGLQAATDYIIALKNRHRQERAILLSALRKSNEIVGDYEVTQLIYRAERWGEEPLHDPRAGS